MNDYTGDVLKLMLGFFMLVAWFIKRIVGAALALAKAIARLARGRRAQEGRTT